MQFRRILQKTRSFAFGGHGTGRASQIQVDFLVPEICKRFGRPDEIVGVSREQLRYGADSFIGLRGEFAQLPIGELWLTRGSDERKVVAVGCSEKLRVQTAIDDGRKTFHGRNGEFGQSGERHEWESAKNARAALYRYRLRLSNEKLVDVKGTVFSMLRSFCKIAAFLFDSKNKKIQRGIVNID